MRRHVQFDLAFFPGFDVKLHEILCEFNIFDRMVMSGKIAFSVLNFHLFLGYFNVCLFSKFLRVSVQIHTEFCAFQSVLIDLGKLSTAFGIL